MVCLKAREVAVSLVQEMVDHRNEGAELSTFRAVAALEQVHSHAVKVEAALLTKDLHD